MLNPVCSADNITWGV